MVDYEREAIGDGGDINCEMMEWFKCHGMNRNGKVVITTFFQGQTKLATHLCIHSPASKLACDSDQGFSIGGTYNDAKEEFWFFGSTSLCHGNNYLLKLFVMTRRNMRFSLFLPSIRQNITNQIKLNEADKYSEITGPNKEYIFKTSKKDEIVFIKAYCFTKADLQTLGNFSLLLPCAIQVHTSYRLHPDIVSKIKLHYTVQLNEALYKTKNEGDFVLESATHNKHPVHLFVAAAHSPVLREVIKSNQKTFFLNCSDEDVETLVSFLYNGSVENLTLRSAPKILELAHMLQLPGMLKLGQIALSANVNVDNAVEIAILAKMYGLKELSLQVFHFIKQNPVLLFGSGILHLNDIDLMRDMLQYVGHPSCEQKKINEYEIKKTV